MTELTCKHCAGSVEIGDVKCSHCGMPLPPGYGKNPQMKFKMFFIFLIVFCAFMIIWLPREWTPFIK